MILGQLRIGARSTTYAALVVMTMMVTTNLWHEQWKLGGLLNSQPVAESS